MRGTGTHARVVPSVSTTSSRVTTSNGRHLASLASAHRAIWARLPSSTLAPTPCLRNVRRVIESPPEPPEVMKANWIPEQHKSVVPMLGAMSSGAHRWRWCRPVKRRDRKELGGSVGGLAFDERQERLG